MAVDSELWKPLRLRTIRKNPGALLRHQDHLFQPHSSQVWQIDTWLYRKYHTIIESQLNLVPGEARRLLDFKANAMAEAVAEMVAHASSFNDLARSGIYPGADLTGASSGQGCILRLEDERIELSRLAGAGRDSYGASHVGMVSGEARSQVQNHEVAALHFPVGGASVRHGAVWASGDDDIESRSVCAVKAQQMFRLDGDFFFSPARRYEVKYLLHDRDGNGGGLTNGLYLVRILPQPQALHDIPARLKTDARQTVRERRLHCQGYVACLKPDALRGAFAQHLGQARHVLLDLVEWEVGGFLRCLQSVAKIAQQERSVGEYEKIASAAAEARQIPQVLRLADEESFRALSVRELSDLLDSLQIPQALPSGMSARAASRARR
jgi:hypothetical protein